MCLDYDGWLNIKMEHSINCKNEKYCPRGNITLKSIRAGIAIVDQINFSKQDLKELKVLILYTHNNSVIFFAVCFFLIHIFFIFQDIADVDGFYTIRTLVTSADSNEIEIFSSVKAQLFLDNGLSDVINAWVLPNGEVIAVNFQVANSSLHNNDLNYERNDEYALNTKFFIHHVEQAPV